LPDDHPPERARCVNAGKGAKAGQAPGIINLGGCRLRRGGKTSLTAADLIPVYDELGMPWGSLRIKPRGPSADPSKEGRLSHRRAYVSMAVGHPAGMLRVGQAFRSIRPAHTCHHGVLG
jgi:hypothetical protein